MNRKIFIILFFLSFSLFPLTASHRIYLGSDLHYRALKQKYVTTSHSDEKAIFSGLQAGYDYVQGNAFYFGGDVFYNSIKALEKSSWFRTNIRNKILNYEGRLGITFGMRRAPLLTLFACYGQHNFSRLANPNENITYSKIRYSWNYIGTGLRSYFYMSRSWQMGLFVKALQIMNGKSFVTPKDSASISIQYQTSGHPSTPIRKQWYYIIEWPNYFYIPYFAPFDIAIIPYFSSLHMKKSKKIVGTFSQGQVFGPTNKTFDVGCRCEIGLSF